MKNGVPCLRGRGPNTSPFASSHVIRITDHYIGYSRSDLAPSFTGVTIPFRLPGLFAPSTMVTTETRKVSGMRIKTYIPPPLTSNTPTQPTPAIRDACDMERTTGDCTPQIKKVLKTNSSSPIAPANIYPSPAPCSQSPRRSRVRSGTVKADSLPLILRDAEIDNQKYRPLSPPTSDPIPMSSHDSDVRIQVDLRIIRENFPRYQESLRKVSFTIALLRNIPCLH